MKDLRFTPGATFGERVHEALDQALDAGALSKLAIEARDAAVVATGLVMFLIRFEDDGGFDGVPLEDFVRHVESWLEASRGR